MKKLLLLICSTVAVLSCGQNNKGNQPQKLLGVPEYMVEQHIVDYINNAESQSLATGQRKIEKLFDDIVLEEQADSTRHAYLRLTELVSKYLYDPNSPLRDEDLYLPFLRKMLDCPYTSEDMKPAYEYEAGVCALNPRESIAADFLFRTTAGRNLHLSDIKSDYVILFFSNPGCEACKEIVETIKSAEFADVMQEEGHLSIVNVYIDQDLKAWRDYVTYYPKSWINGYDPNYIIREDVLYNVRAIPSVYLLGPDKRVVLKDADIMKVLNTLFNIFQQNYESQPQIMG